MHSYAYMFDIPNILVSVSKQEIPVVVQPDKLTTTPAFTFSRPICSRSSSQLNTGQPKEDACAFFNIEKYLY